MNSPRQSFKIENSSERWFTHEFFILTPTLCTGDGKQQIKASQLTKNILQLKIDVVNSNNINVRHLQGKGLQLNQSDSKLLSKTFSNRIERF